MSNYEYSNLGIENNVNNMKRSTSLPKFYNLNTKSLKSDIDESAIESLSQDTDSILFILYQFIINFLPCLLIESSLNLPDIMNLIFLNIYQDNTSKQLQISYSLCQTFFLFGVTRFGDLVYGLRAKLPFAIASNNRQLVSELIQYHLVTFLFAYTFVIIGSNLTLPFLKIIVKTAFLKNTNETEIVMQMYDFLLISCQSMLIKWMSRMVQVILQYYGKQLGICIIILFKLIMQPILLNIYQEINQNLGQLGYINALIEVLEFIALMVLLLNYFEITKNFALSKVEQSLKRHISIMNPPIKILIAQQLQYFSNAYTYFLVIGSMSVASIRSSELINAFLISKSIQTSLCSFADALVQEQCVTIGYNLAKFRYKNLSRLSYSYIILNTGISLTQITILTQCTKYYMPYFSSNSFTLDSLYENTWFMLFALLIYVMTAANRSFIQGMGWCDVQLWNEVSNDMIIGVPLSVQMIWHQQIAGAWVALGLRVWLKGTFAFRNLIRCDVQAACKKQIMQQYVNEDPSILRKGVQNNYYNDSDNYSNHLQF